MPAVHSVAILNKETSHNHIVYIKKSKAGMHRPSWCLNMGVSYKPNVNQLLADLLVWGGENACQLGLPTCRFLLL